MFNQIDNKFKMIYNITTFTCSYKGKKLIHLIQQNLSKNSLVLFYDLIKVFI